MKEDQKLLLPMAPATLHILLALAVEDMHGYGIMREVERQSDGHYRLGPGTLYDNLQRLLQQQLVQEAGQGPDENSRRRYYRLTAAGRRVLSAEITRLDGVVRSAKLYLRAIRPRRA